MVCHCLLQPGNLVFLLRPRGDLQLSAVTEDGQLQHAQIQARFRFSETCTSVFSNARQLVDLYLLELLRHPAVGVE